MNNIIRHDENREIFEIHIDGYLSFLKYQIVDSTLDIVSTFVPKQIEGRGVASKLVQAAHSYAIENGFLCKGSCSYAALWIERHK